MILQKRKQTYNYRGEKQSSVKSS